MPRASVATLSALGTRVTALHAIAELLRTEIITVRRRLAGMRAPDDSPLAGPLAIAYREIVAADEAIDAPITALAEACDALRSIGR